MWVRKSSVNGKTLLRLDSQTVSDERCKFGVHNFCLNQIIHHFNAQGEAAEQGENYRIHIEI